MVYVYSLGAATPVATLMIGSLDGVIAAGTRLALVPYGAKWVDVFDLTGSSLVPTHYPLPSSYLYSFFGADGAGNWVVGSGGGAIFDSSHLGGTQGAQPLSCGRVRSVAGSPTGRVAIATDSGQILCFDLANEVSAPAPSDVFMFPSAKLELSNDGRVLAATGSQLVAPYHPDWSLALFDLSVGARTRTFTYSYETYPNNLLVDFELSAGATSVGQTVGSWDDATTTWTFERTVTSLSTEAATFSDTYSVDLGAPSAGLTQPMKLSPDGPLTAVLNLDANLAETTVIYRGSTPVGQSNGHPGQPWCLHSSIMIGGGRSLDPAFGQTCPPGRQSKATAGGSW